MDKKKKRILTIGVLTVFTFLIMTALYNKPITREEESGTNTDAVEASVYPLQEKDWSLKYHVKKQRIYIENIIPRFSFKGSVSQLPDHRDGYIAVFINGKWIMNANQSVFILKNISRGKHEITLQLKKKDGTDYGIKKNIYVHVR